MSLAAEMRRRDGEDYADVARRAAALGFRGVSLPYDEGWSDADLIGIRQAFDEAGVAIVELKCRCNFLTPRGDEAAQVVGRLQKALADGAILNCDCATTYAGSRHPDPRQPLAPHPDNWADATWDLLIHRIWSLLGGVDDLGVCLCFEPCATTTLNSLDSLSELNADAASFRVRIALDPAAIFTAAAAEHPAVGLAETFATLADTIVLARATDLALIEVGREPVVQPAPLGEGVLDYPTYLKLLDALERDTPLVVRHQPTDDAYRAAHAFVADAAKEAGLAL